MKGAESNVYLTCIYRISIVYLSCIYRVSIVFGCMKGVGKGGVVVCKSRVISSERVRKLKSRVG